MHDESALSIDIEEKYSLSELKECWSALEEKADNSFFNSWFWIENWLFSLPENYRPVLLSVRQGAETVGLGFLMHRNLVRHLCFPYRAYFLHESGDESVDQLTIEHNGFLVKEGREQEVLKTIAGHFYGSLSDWDEIYFGGVKEGLHSTMSEAFASPDSESLIVKEEAGYFVNLDALSEEGVDYLDRASRHARKHIRRSLKYHGNVEVNKASSCEDALEIFKELRDFHQERWQARDLQGSFSSDFMLNFHERLIRNCYDNGYVDLLRICSESETIGCLYNFLYADRVVCYQSGINYSQPKHHPGLLTHYVAVEHYQQQGFKLYDFLAGESRYKRELATDSYKMFWLVVQRKRLKFLIEEVLRKIKRKFV